MNRPLTDKQKRFCREYIKDFIGTQAAIRAGYSVRSAQEIASANMRKPHIRKRIWKLSLAKIRKGL